MRKFDLKLKSYPKFYNDKALITKDSRYYDILENLVKIYLI